MPVPQQGPQSAPVVPADVAASENADVGNANQNPGPPAAPGPPLEVKLPFLLNSRLLGLYDFFSGVLFLHVKTLVRNILMCVVPLDDASRG